MRAEVLERREQGRERLEALSQTLPRATTPRAIEPLGESELTRKELRAINRQRLRAHKHGMTLEQFQAHQQSIQERLEEISRHGYETAERQGATVASLRAGLRQLAGGVGGTLNWIGDTFGGRSSYMRVTFSDRMSAFTRGVSEWNEENLSYMGRVYTGVLMSAPTTIAIMASGGALGGTVGLKLAGTKAAKALGAKTIVSKGGTAAGISFGGKQQIVAMGGSQGWAYGRMGATIYTTASGNKYTEIRRNENMSNANIMTNLILTAVLEGATSSIRFNVLQRQINKLGKETLSKTLLQLGKDFLSEGTGEAVFSALGIDIMDIMTNAKDELHFKETLENMAMSFLIGGFSSSTISPTMTGVSRLASKRYIELGETGIGVHRSVLNDSNRANYEDLARRFVRQEHINGEINADLLKHMRIINHNNLSAHQANEHFLMTRNKELIAEFNERKAEWLGGVYVNNTTDLITQIDNLLAKYNENIDIDVLNAIKFEAEAIKSDIIRQRELNEIAKAKNEEFLEYFRDKEPYLEGMGYNPIREVNVETLRTYRRMIESIIDYYHKLYDGFEGTVSIDSRALLQQSESTIIEIDNLIFERLNAEQDTVNEILEIVNTVPWNLDNIETIKEIASEANLSSESIGAVLQAMIARKNSEKEISESNGIVSEINGQITFNDNLNEIINQNHENIDIINQEISRYEELSNQTRMYHPEAAAQFDNSIEALKQRKERLSAQNDYIMSLLIATEHSYRNINSVYKSLLSEYMNLQAEITAIQLDITKINTELMYLNDMYESAGLSRPQIQNLQNYQQQKTDLQGELSALVANEKTATPTEQRIIRREKARINNEIKALDVKINELTALSSKHVSNYKTEIGEKIKESMNQVQELRAMATQLEQQQAPMRKELDSLLKEMNELNLRDLEAVLGIDDGQLMPEGVPDEMNIDRNRIDDSIDRDSVIPESAREVVRQQEQSAERNTIVNELKADEKTILEKGGWGSDRGGVVFPFKMFPSSLGEVIQRFETNLQKIDEMGGSTYKPNPSIFNIIKAFKERGGHEGYERATFDQKRYGHDYVNPNTISRPNTTNTTGQQTSEPNVRHDERSSVHTQVQEQSGQQSQGESRETGQRDGRITEQNREAVGTEIESFNATIDDIKSILGDGYRDDMSFVENALMAKYTLLEAYKKSNDVSDLMELFNYNWEALYDHLKPEHKTVYDQLGVEINNITEGLQAEVDSNLTMFEKTGDRFIDFELLSLQKEFTMIETMTEAQLANQYTQAELSVMKNKYLRWQKNGFAGHGSYYIGVRFQSKKRNERQRGEVNWKRIEERFNTNIHTYIKGLFAKPHEAIYVEQARIASNKLVRVLNKYDSLRTKEVMSETEARRKQIFELFDVDIAEVQAEAVESAVVVETAPVVETTPVQTAPKVSQNAMLEAKVKYDELKANYRKSERVFVRVGDYYFTFGLDAKVLKDKLGMAVTRDGVASIPVGQLDGVLGKLEGLGERYVVSDRVGEGAGKGLPAVQETVNVPVKSENTMSIKEAEKALKDIRTEIISLRKSADKINEQISDANRLIEANEKAIKDPNKPQSLKENLTQQVKDARARKGRLEIELNLIQDRVQEALEQGNTATQTIYEAAQLVHGEPAYKDDVSFTTNPKNVDIVMLGSDLARAFHHRAVFTDGLHANDIALLIGDTIYINTKHVNNKNIKEIVAHELLHSLKNTDPAAFDGLVRLLETDAYRQEWENFKKKNRDRLSKNYSEVKINEELAIRYLQSKVFSEKYIRRALARTVNENRAYNTGRFWSNIKKFFTNAIEYLDIANPLACKLVRELQSVFDTARENWYNDVRKENKGDYYKIADDIMDLLDMSDRDIAEGIHRFGKENFREGKDAEVKKDKWERLIKRSKELGEENSLSTSLFIMALRSDPLYDSNFSSEASSVLNMKGVIQAAQNVFNEYQNTYGDINNLVELARALPKKRRADVILSQAFLEGFKYHVEKAQNIKDRYLNNPEQRTPEETAKLRAEWKLHTEIATWCNEAHNHMLSTGATIMALSRHQKAFKKDGTVDTDFVLEAIEQTKSHIQDYYTRLQDNYLPPDQQLDRAIERATSNEAIYETATETLKNIEKKIGTENLDAILEGAHKREVGLISSFQRLIRTTEKAVMLHDGKMIMLSENELSMIKSFEPKMRELRRRRNANRMATDETVVFNEGVVLQEMADTGVLQEAIVNEINAIAETKEMVKQAKEVKAKIDKIERQERWRILEGKNLNDLLRAEESGTLTDKDKARLTRYRESGFLTAGDKKIIQPTLANLWVSSNYSSMLLNAVTLTKNFTLSLFGAILNQTASDISDLIRGRQVVGREVYKDAWRRTRSFAKQVWQLKKELLEGSTQFIGESKYEMSTNLYDLANYNRITQILIKSTQWLGNATNLAMQLGDGVVREFVSSLKEESMILNLSRNVELQAELKMNENQLRDYLYRSDSKPAQQIRDEAFKKATEYILMQQPEGSLGFIAKKISEWRNRTFNVDAYDSKTGEQVRGPGKWGLMKIKPDHINGWEMVGAVLCASMLPFVRIATNYIQQAIDWSFPASAYNYAKGKSVKNKKMEELMKTLANHKNPMVEFIGNMEFHETMVKDEMAHLFNNMKTIKDIEGIDLQNLQNYQQAKETLQDIGFYETLTKKERAEFDKQLQNYIKLKNSLPTLLETLQEAQQKIHDLEAEAAISKFNVYRDDELKLVKMIASIIAATIAWILALDGKVTGSGFSMSRAERTARLATGWRPNSIKVGNQYFSLEQFPIIALQMAMIGNISEVMRSDKYTNDYEEGISRTISGVMGIGQTIMDMSFVRGITDVANIVTTDNPQRAYRYITDMATRPLWWNYNQVRYLSDMIFDTQVKDTNTYAGIMAQHNRTLAPIFYRDVPSRVNIFGETITQSNARRRGIGREVFSFLGLPVGTSTVQNHTLRKMQRDLANVGVFLGQPNGNVVVNGHNLRNHPRLREKYLKERGWVYSEEMLRRQNTINRLILRAENGDERAVERLRNISSQANARANATGARKVAMYSELR